MDESLPCGPAVFACASSSSSSSSPPSRKKKVRSVRKSSLRCNLCCSLRGESIDTALHRVWECSSCEMDRSAAADHWCETGRRGSGRWWRFTSLLAWHPGQARKLTPRSSPWSVGFPPGRALVSRHATDPHTWTARALIPTTVLWLALGGRQRKRNESGRVVEAAYGNVPAHLTQSAAVA